MTEKTRGFASGSGQTALKVSQVAIAGNIALALFKGFAGIVGHSSAMLSDAIHTATDVISTFVLMVGIRLSNRKADSSYPYGYERMENIAAMILAMILAMAGIGVGVSGLEKVWTGNYGQAIPGVLALVAAVVSILMKEGMYWYMRAAAQKVRSSALMADAWHQRSDALSSVGSFVGVLGARLGMPALDPLASLLICGFILHTAWDIFREAVSKVTDQAACSDTCDAIAEVIQKARGVQGLSQLRTRLFGERVYVEADVYADGSLPLHRADALEADVQLAVEAAFPQVKRCRVRAVSRTK